MLSDIAIYTITVYKPAAPCNRVKSMLADRSCRNYTGGMFGVPLSDPEQIRNKLRPDLMIVKMSAVEYGQYMQHAVMAQLCPQMLDGKPRKVWIAEAGYCSDTMYEDKLMEKELQHKRLQEALSAYGYEVIAVPIILGFYGTIFTTTVQSAQTLGIERVRVNRLMNTLHAHAITSLHTIIKLRRKLERSPTSRRRSFLQTKG